MIAPALTAIGRGLDIPNEVELPMILSIFVLAYAIGPLVLDPLSETYGRVNVLQLTNVIYLCFNMGCGFAQNKGQMIAFRLLSGLGLPWKWSQLSEWYSLAWWWSLERSLER